MALTADAFKLVYDSENHFHTIGVGDLGGKARGLVHLERLLRKNKQLLHHHSEVRIGIPSTLIIAGDAFDEFLTQNHLEDLRSADPTDEQIATSFLKADMPEEVAQSLADYLKKATYPLAVRSSGQMEDAMYHAYAGLYNTYMLSNDQAQVDRRLDALLRAIKLVYASTFYKSPQAYAQRVGHDIANDRMAVMVQQVVGIQRGGYCYPDISGVAQSRNYYPLAGIKPDDGLAAIALGLGKQVVSGARALRFSPNFPQRLLQGNTVEEMLAYAQRYFYALPMGTDTTLDIDERSNLARRNVNSAETELPLKALASTYVLNEHRLRDSVSSDGPKVLTFAGVLKHNLFPLAGLLRDLLDLGQAALNAPVEIEFAANLAHDQQPQAQFFLLQMRPMTARVQGAQITIRNKERRQALCYTRHAMGNGRLLLKDIVYVKPDAFDPARTRAVAAEIAHINARLGGQQLSYLLIGPGRWGSADPWLGIPVRWADISQVGAIVETASEKLNAEPSQGAHFFHNLAALGISYLGVSPRAPDTINWSWLVAQPKHDDTDHVVHVRLDKPLLIKVDGRSLQGVIVLTK